MVSLYFDLTKRIISRPAQQYQKPCTFSSGFHPGFNGQKILQANLCIFDGLSVRFLCSDCSENTVSPSDHLYCYK